MFERMELKALTKDDLGALLASMRALATSKNRIGLDLFCVVETEMLLRHEPTEIAHYSDDEISKAVAAIAAAIDASRKAGIADDYPAVRFLLFTIGALLDEMERRGLVHELQ